MKALYLVLQNLGSLERGFGCTLLNPPFQYLQIDDHGVQRILEFVGQVIGQGADRGKPTRIDLLL